MILFFLGDLFIDFIEMFQFIDFFLSLGLRISDIGTGGVSTDVGVGADSLVIQGAYLRFKSTTTIILITTTTNLFSHI